MCQPFWAVKVPVNLGSNTKAFGSTLFGAKMVPKWNWKLGVERVWKIKYWSGIGYLKKFKYGSSRVRVHVKLYQKTLASLAKWSIDTKVWNMCLRQRQIFPWPQNFSAFYHVSSFKSINIFSETDKYHNWANPLPFRVGYWGANTRTPKSVPSTRSIPSLGMLWSECWMTNEPLSWW